MPQASERDTTRRELLGVAATLALPAGLAASAAVAHEPVTQKLLLSYAEWLLMERRVLLMEMYPGVGLKDLEDFIRYVGGEVSEFHTPCGRNWQEVPKPSTRAALVLNAVGCQWKRA